MDSISSPEYLQKLANEAEKAYLQGASPDPYYRIQITVQNLQKPLAKHTVANLDYTTHCLANSGSQITGNPL